jgi:dihydroxyacetone kinase
MALGLGIHGEPGIKEEAIVPARDLAKLLTEKLLAERPAGTSKVGVVLNGLGATKYEELFVLWTTVSTLLKDAGLDVVAPEVGEFVTSLDMQGCSLTLLWLDDELETLWLAACDTPVLRRGATFSTEPATDALEDIEGKMVFAPASQVSKQAGKCVAGLLSGIAAALKDAEDELGRIDAQAGDGDHGQGMRRGSAAALGAANAAVATGAGAASVLAVAGDAWADRAGGTSGASGACCCAPLATR